MTAIDRILQSYRDAAATEREKGTYFERLGLAFFLNDPVQVEEYEAVWPWSEWAKANGWDGKDVGIDLVAKLRNEDGFAAIQAKFYAADTRIQKSHIDSFISASGKEPFRRRVVLDTTEQEWSANAEEMIRGQAIPVVRIGLTDLRESRIDWTIFEARGEIVLAAKKTLMPHQWDALAAVGQGLAAADRGKMIMACGTGKTFTSLKIAEAIAGKGKRVLFMVPSLALMSQTVREWTYQSIVTQTRAQAAGLPDFDLIICDEAHRTTGATLDGEEESNFVKIHSNDHVRARKRLYMTATPRIFGDNVRSKADEVGAELASMDNPALFGETLFYRGFGWAVQNGLLTDYKVIVLAMDEGLVSAAVQKRLGDAGSELALDDATKIIGCYKALTKIDLKADVTADPHPMRRAIAFARDIRSSKLIRDEFGAVVDEYLGQDSLIESEEPSGHLQCEIEHVDGTFNAKTRGALLDWLKADAGDNTCRILTNARCLSEGVDVPALDAIMFLHPRKSQIDVVQSVGRVMRRAEGKKMGYVILPVGVPAGVPPEQALADNERYRVVWQILNALRAHDERFESTINKMSLGQDISDTIEIVGVNADTEELRSVTAVVQNLPNKTKAAGSGIGSGNGGPGDDVIDSSPVQIEMSFSIDEFSRAIMAKIVKKCGTRDYWEDWSTSIAEIAKNHITRLQALLKDSDTEARLAFDGFLAELRDDLNDTISEGDAVEMLAQHIITRPVFETLFEGHKFTAENPVSRAMQRVLDVLNEANLDKESRDLEKFYASVKLRSQGITDPQAKQKLIVELYDKFFRRAFPRTTEKMGIVYTPVEIVDFIIHSVNEVLQSEFGQTLGSPGVHIIDPFTGTGTFITRLLQSGLIAPEEMEHKFRHEIHANEIVLLAYYIAAINIEAVYHGLQGGEYVPFEGICLTDTFQMYESNDLISHYMPDNSERRKRQKATDIRVIVGNPPYSAGQGSANDNNANVVYPTLDGRIRDTYAARSSNTNMRSLYDSYIRAVRWGSDRIGEAGVMAYVSNAGWLEGTAADGMRACLESEFSNLYIFHLRGNARTSGEQRRKEKGNVFGEGTRTPISISVFVKNPSAAQHGQIHFHDIGDYLDQKQKLSIVRDFGSIGGISNINGWAPINPNEHHDWLGQRGQDFEKFLPISAKGGVEAGLFETHSAGLKTNRDVWVYDSSKEQLEARTQESIQFFNHQVDLRQANPDYVIDTEPTKFKWCQATIRGVEKGRKIEFHEQVLQQAMYRPFLTTWVYKHKSLNWSSYLMPRFFPEASTNNLAICASGPGGRGNFSALMTNAVPSIHFADVDGVQCYPLRIFSDTPDETETDLFASMASSKEGLDGITDAGLKHFQDAYPNETITKVDLFYYVYGLLHSEDYRAKYADNLSKELPRIPRVTTAADFWAFSRAGRTLGDLHVDYETVEPYPVTIKQGDLRLADIKNPEAFYRVTKWAFGKSGKDKDKTTVIYNANITMQDVPLEAYDYVVNGKPALEWVMERQVVKTDKDSGIENDANRYAIETMNNPAYPLELFQRVITVSLRTTEIVRALPKLEVM
jgi:predicted helicase